METTRKLKRIIIKEELVELTGSYIDAVLLNQLLYWSERVKDFDEFIKQEAESENKEPEGQLYGWIYKSLVELSEETMLGLSPNGIKNHLKKLCDLGFISIRQNKNKWDRRKEYKVNLICIQKKLYDLGYSLDGYSLILPFAENANGNADTANRTVKNCKTVTEITTETTTEKKKARKKVSVDYDEILSVIENSELKNAFYEFIKMRKLIKKPMTNKALKMLIDKVEKFGSDEETQIKILEQSILHNWMSVYPLKAEKTEKAVDSDVDETERMLAERRKEREAMLNNV